jgi:PAB1-binding protein PBP1
MRNVSSPAMMRAVVPGAGMDTGSTGGMYPGGVPVQTISHSRYAEEPRPNKRAIMRSHAISEVLFLNVEVGLVAVGETVEFRHD